MMLQVVCEQAYVFKLMLTNYEIQLKRLFDPQSGAVPKIMQGKRAHPLLEAVRTCPPTVGRRANVRVHPLLEEGRMYVSTHC